MKPKSGQKYKEPKVAQKTATEWSEEDRQDALKYLAFLVASTFDAPVTGDDVQRALDTSVSHDELEANDDESGTSDPPSETLSYVGWREKLLEGCPKNALYPIVSTSADTATLKNPHEDHASLLLRSWECPHCGAIQPIEDVKKMIWSKGKQRKLSESGKDLLCSECGEDPTTHHS